MTQPDTLKIDCAARFTVGGHTYGIIVTVDVGDIEGIIDATSEDASAVFLTPSRRAFFVEQHARLHFVELEQPAAPAELTPQMVAEMLLKVDERVDGLEQAFDGGDVLTRLSDLEGKVGTLQADIQTVQTTLHVLARRD